MVFVWWNISIGNSEQYSLVKKWIWHAHISMEPLSKILNLNTIGTLEGQINSGIFVGLPKQKKWGWQDTTPKSCTKTKILKTADLGKDIGNKNNSNYFLEF